MASEVSSTASFLLAIDKPVGMSSHDVVNRVRRICGERRVGHCGTLDPLASGVLLVAVGPAARLDAYVVGHDKRYRMGVFFGAGTETDDAEGQVIKQISPSSNLLDAEFASAYVQSLVGSSTQMPPVYSAIKVKGQTSYKAARAGKIIPLEPRPFTVYDAKLIGVREGVCAAGIEGIEWDIEMSVSSGTYMRSIARDAGRDLQSAAHVSHLRRIQSGAVSIEQCVSLEELESDPASALVDPLEVLGLRFAFAREYSKQVTNGTSLPGDALVLNEAIRPSMLASCSCTTSVIPSKKPPNDTEIVAVLVDRRLKALYEYSVLEHRYNPRCVFSIGVERGSNI